MHQYSAKTRFAAYTVTEWSLNSDLILSPSPLDGRMNGTCAQPSSTVVAPPVFPLITPAAKVPEWFC
jgi:hypothetical protein